MKHIFIINPAAGKGKPAKKIIPEIEDYFSVHPELTYEIYETKAPRDGQAYVESVAKQGEAVRFYACGGDGTLYEVVNGAYRYPNAAVGIIPLGSGNDFVRVFGGSPKMMDVAAQVEADTLPFDLIQAGDHVAINQCSMGLDAEVCAKQAHFKKIPGVTGGFAYTLALIYCLLCRMRSNFCVKADGKVLYDGPIIFSLCGNGRCYGGGYKGAPLSVPSDGLLDFVLMPKNMSRLKMFSLIGTYKNGKHLPLPCTHFARGKKLEIISKDLAAVNVDGECEYVNKSTFQILEHALPVIVPDPQAYEQTMANGYNIDPTLFK